MRAAARRLRLLPAAPARLHGWPLPWVGQRPAVFHRVHSSGYRAADRKPSAPLSGSSALQLRYNLYNVQFGAYQSRCSDNNSKILSDFLCPPPIHESRIVSIAIVQLEYLIIKSDMAVNTLSTPQKSRSIFFAPPPIQELGSPSRL